MVFPENYFEDEVREGFFIPSMMKRCWAAQLQVLEDVDALCEKYNIKYYGDSGTLIGAVRHGGFIPWDDDMDIAMLREDYECFLEHAHELPEFYSVLNWRETDEWNNAYSRVINTERIRFDGEFMEYFHGFPYSAGLDIFVTDYMYEDPEKEEERRERAKLLMEAAQGIFEHGKEDEAYYNMISSLEKMYGIRLDLNRSVVKQLRLLAEEAMTEVKREDATKVCFMSAWIKDHGCTWEKKCCDQMMRVPFECTTIPIPVAYDAILKAHYGDYMHVNRNGGLHDFPYYRKQEEILAEKYGWKAWNYAWNPEEITLGKRIREEQAVQNNAIETQIKQIETMIASNPETYGGLQAQVDSLKQNLKSRLSKKDGKEEVVFLCLGPKWWSNYAYFWEREQEKGNTDVYVIPIPYFDTAINGTTTGTHYETEGYEIPVVSYEDYNLEQRHPSCIYIQCPYDYVNPALSVHPVFYSGDLLKYTDELIYVPMFDIKEFAPDDAKSAYGMNYYVKSPVVMHADKIYLPSERLKEAYVSCLVEFSKGEADEAFWNDRIFVEDYMCEERITKEKKTILYCTDVAPIALYGKKALNKVRSSLELLKESADRLNVIWYISENTEDVLLSDECNHGRELYEELLKIVEEYLAEGWGAYAELLSDLDLDAIDAYAGNPSFLAHELSYHKKPVMILKDYDE